MRTPAHIKTTTTGSPAHTRAWHQQYRAMLPALCVCACVCVFGLGAGSALALRGRVFEGTFGKHGSGAGELSEPGGVAVNEETGVVYVVDKAAGRVEYFKGKVGEMTPLGEFDGSGTYGEGAAAGSGTHPEDEEATGKFSEPDGVAVDNSCWEHKPKLTETTVPKCSEYDPSYGDIYVVDVNHNVVDKYTATGKYVGQINAKTIGFPALATYHPSGDGLFKAVAVSSAGAVLILVNSPYAQRGVAEGVFELSDGVVNEKAGFTTTDRFPESFWDVVARVGGGFFVSAGGVDDRAVVGYGPKGELLYGPEIAEPLDGEFVNVNSSGLAVESCSGDVYIDEDAVGLFQRGTGAVVGRFTGGGELVEELAVPGGGGAHLAVDCASESVFVGNAGGGVVDVYGPTPPGAPEVLRGSGFVSEVGTVSAKLSARVNPRSDLGESETVYAFEYGLCPAEGSCAGAGFEHSVGGGGVVASYEASEVSAVAQGLVAGARYHYRLSAHNSHDPEPGEWVHGEELFFATQTVFPGGLLDGRGWELVSPPDKHGANIKPIGEEGVVQASADGSALTWMANAPIEDDAAGNAASGVQVVSRRSVEGWSSCDVNLPNVERTGPSVGNGYEYAAFSPDLGLGLARPFGDDAGVLPLISSEATELTPFVASLGGVCGARPSYRPLVTAQNTRAEAKFGEEGTCNAVFCGPRFEGSNTDLSSIVMKAENASLLEEVEGYSVPVGALYESYEGDLSVVSVLPGSDEPVGTKVALGSQGGETGSVRGAVSADGSRVVWSEKRTGGHLYVWDRGTGHSALVDRVMPGATGSGVTEPVFQYMTPDGKHVFFTDEKSLTVGSGAASSSKQDLYECEVVVEAGEPRCEVSDLTPATGGEAAGVLGLVLGGSEDGSVVYFVANGTLDASPSASGETAVKGDCGDEEVAEETQVCNLFVAEEGHVSLVAILSGQDDRDWGGAASNDALNVLTGAVSSDGGWLAFMSSRSLTGYDNRDVHRPSQRDEEVYLYHAAAHGLVCVSCNPTGERPNGVEYAKLNDGVAGGDRVWPLSRWIAGSVPGWTPWHQRTSQYQSRYLDGSGRIFFDSSDALVPQDTNGAEDVYEYEPVGVGSCELNGPGYEVASDGCLGLVSSGESGEESGFLDASQSGDDVFFLTSAPLSKRDTDTAYDIYDARVGGTESEEPKAVECQGDACQAPVSPPESLTPSSLTSNGPGNLLTPPAPGTAPKTVVKTKTKSESRTQKLAKALKQCRKTKSKARRVACERGARNAYGVKAKVKRKITKRRAG